MSPHEVKPVKILIAESDISLRGLLSEYLLRLGYEVCSAQDGNEAVDRARSEVPDLVIIATGLRGLDAVEVCRRLKSDASIDNVPFLFLTFDDDIEQALKAGADDYLTKPFNPRDLELKIIAVLRRRRPDIQLPPAPTLTAPAISKSVGGEPTRRAQSTKKANDPFRIRGTVLNGKYELTEFAGAGGMGAVYRATNLTNRETVAVKILQPHIVARSPECAELFEREAKHAQSLDHPHIVKIFDSGKDEDLSYMVMEWVEGHSVEDVLTQGHLPLERLRNIFEQICSAVAFAHERKIIHLDLKPGNILLLGNAEPDDFVKVIDFGLSKVISKESGTTVTKFRGTHQFCAPEQFGGKVSHRSDVYSLGATLYYLLTGVIPFGASYINAKFHANLELPPIPSVARQRNLPARLDSVISKALSKEPSLRQGSAKQLFEEFKEAISERGEIPRPESDETVSKADTAGSEADSASMVLAPPDSYAAVRVWLERQFPDGVRTADAGQYVDFMAANTDGTLVGVKVQYFRIRQGYMKRRFRNAENKLDQALSEGKFSTAWLVLVAGNSNVLTRLNDYINESSTSNISFTVGLINDAGEFEAVRSTPEAPRSADEEAVRRRAIIARRDWNNPQVACSLLSHISGLQTRGYKNVGAEGDFSCCSPSMDLDESIPANNIAYYAEGDAVEVNRLKLVLNVNDKQKKDDAHLALLRYSEELAPRALGEELWPEMREAIILGRPFAYMVEELFVELKVEAWVTGRGYDMKFIITQPINISSPLKAKYGYVPDETARRILVFLDEPRHQHVYAVEIGNALRLPQTLVKSYLDILAEEDYVRIIPDNRTNSDVCTITPKGKQFLDKPE
jgi:serine/threonine protein kinase